MTSVKGPVIYCVDDTKPDGSSPAIMGFVLANYARDMVRLSPEERCVCCFKNLSCKLRLFTTSFSNAINVLIKRYIDVVYNINVSVNSYFIAQKLWYLMLVFF